MKIVDLVRWMHADFRQRLDKMERIAKEGGVGEAAKVAHELSLVLQSLQAHEWLEEEVLYPYLRTRVPGFDAKAPEESAVGHRALQGKVSELKEALAHPDATLTLLFAAEIFIAFLREHMAAEEKGILDSADKRLPEPVQEKLAADALKILKEAGLPEEFLPR
ncbi:MAG TPA: hemerythrin domain-containing protein [Elusimicrobiota bacterium]|jgi:hemerythrin-like domain-containing protein|nr:hemerythrin domain-containing protein [Elusimicrobiota bacterium]